MVAVFTSWGGSTPASGIVLEAHWQFDVKRLSFGNLSALTAELETRIAAADMTVDEYERFKEE